jgi:hypothetical protein
VDLSEEFTRFLDLVSMSLMLNNTEAKSAWEKSLEAAWITIKEEHPALEIIMLRTTLKKFKEVCLESNSSLTQVKMKIIWVQVNMRFQAALIKFKSGHNLQRQQEELLDLLGQRQNQY